MSATAEGITSTKRTLPGEDIAQAHGHKKLDLFSNLESATPQVYVHIFVTIGMFNNKHLNPVEKSGRRDGNVYSSMADRYGT